MSESVSIKGETYWAFRKKVDMEGTGNVSGTANKLINDYLDEQDRLARLRLIAEVAEGRKKES